MTCVRVLRHASTDWNVEPASGLTDTRSRRGESDARGGACHAAELEAIQQSIAAARRTAEMIQPRAGRAIRRCAR